MLPAADPCGRFHQIVYAYAALKPHLLGEEGVGPVASSLADPDLRAWHAELSPRLVDPRYGQPSMCYLASNGSAALLYRDTAHGLSRNSEFAHVLIGSAQELSVQRALGAWRWNWPGAISAAEIPGERMPAVATTSFTGHADAGWRELRAGARSDPELDWLVIEVLRGSAAAAPSMPERQFAVITAPSSVITAPPLDRVPPLPVRLLAGLASHFGPAFLEGGFSTYEEEYSDSVLGLPKFVFTTNSPYSMTQMSRAVVDLRTLPVRPGEDVRQAADILLRAYQRNKIAGVARALKGAAVQGVAPEETSWLPAFLGVFDRQHGSPATQQPPVPEEFEEADYPGRAWVRAGAENFTAPGRRDLRPVEGVSEFAAGGSGIDGQNPRLSDLSDLDLIAMLRNLPQEDVPAVGHEMVRRTARPRVNPVDAAGIRAHLYQNEFYIEHLARLDDNADAQGLAHLYAGLIGLAFSDVSENTPLRPQDAGLMLGYLRLPWRLTQKIMERIGPGIVARPDSYALEVGRARLECLGVHRDASARRQDPAPGPRDTGGPPASAAAWVGVALAVACFVILFLLLLGGKP